MAKSLTDRQRQVLDHVLPRMGERDGHGPTAADVGRRLGVSGSAVYAALISLRHQKLLPEPQRKLLPEPQRSPVVATLVGPCELLDSDETYAVVTLNCNGPTDGEGLRRLLAKSGHPLSPFDFYLMMSCLEDVGSVTGEKYWQTVDGVEMVERRYRAAGPGKATNPEE
jgi:hypothetical protein